MENLPIPYNLLKCEPKNLFSDPLLYEYLKTHWIGSQPFDLSMQNIQKIPIKTTLRVNTILYNPAELIKELEKIFCKPKFTIQIHPLLFDIIEISSNLTEIPKIIQKPQKLIIDSRCACYVLRGASIFCKGLMASTQFNENDEISVYFSEKNYTGGTIIDNEQFNKISHELIFIGNGICKMSRKTAITAKNGIMVEMTTLLAEKAFPFSFEILDPEKYYPQNIGSALVAHLLQPQQGEFILDACAAPGGKTTHLAILMKNKGKILAIDKSLERLKLINKSCLEQKITCIECVKGDSCEILKPGKILKSVTGNTIKLDGGLFDRIIVDPPCSSFGVKPFLGKIVTSLKDIENLVKTQRKILENCAFLLKKQGILSFSTCTITPQENEENIRFIINKLGLKLLKTERIVPSIESSILPKEESNLVQRIELNSDYNGFFVAIFIKP